MIAAIILAAGQSRRMGRNKLLLPFGESTMIETIVGEVMACEAVRDIIVVTGHENNLVEARLAHTPVRCVFNPAYAQSEMLVSIQVGLRALSDEAQAALLVLGDQPRLQRDIVQRVIAAHAPDTLVIPSYHRQRGHPILIDRALWPEVEALPATVTLRDFMRAHEQQIRYVEVEMDSILKDIDTPEEYESLLDAGK